MREVEIVLWWMELDAEESGALLYKIFDALFRDQTIYLKHFFKVVVEVEAREFNSVNLENVDMNIVFSVVNLVCHLDGKGIRCCKILYRCIQILWKL